MPDCRRAVGEAAFEAARAEGKRLGLEEALAEVAALPPAGAPAGTEATARPDTAPGPTLPEASAPTTASTLSTEPDDRLVTGPTPGGPEPSIPPDLAVRLLGGFEVLVRGAPVAKERWSYARPRELLAHLVARRDGSPRDRLAGQLWSDVPDDGLKNRFHVTLHHLRKALGQDGWVELADDRYRIRPDVTVEVDAVRFEEAARGALASVRARTAGGAGAASTDPDRVAGPLRAALEQYGGELLEGEAVGPGLEEWRDRLRGLALDLHLALGALYEAQGDPGRAALSYSAGAGCEPLSEEAHRGLMRAWTAGGERARAAAHYARVRALLHETLGVEPDPVTTALAAELGLGGSA